MRWCEPVRRKGFAFGGTAAAERGAREAAAPVDGELAADGRRGPASRIAIKFTGGGVSSGFAVFCADSEWRLTGKACAISRPGGRHRSRRG